MNDKIIFREKLSEIRELADVQGNNLKVEQINEFFEADSFTSEQMELVYSYLEANKIIVEGHEKSDKTKLFEETKQEIHEEESDTIDSEEHKTNEEEDKYLTMYLDELKNLPEPKEQELKVLYLQVLQNDPLAKSKLIERYLFYVVEIAKDYVNQGVALSDLIQEGNVGLMLALDEIMEGVTSDTMESVLKESIMEAMRSAIEETDSVQEADKHLVNRVNYLSEGAQNLEEELGRTVQIEELAKYMEMSEEEVRDIIRVSDDEIIVKENEAKKNQQA